MRKVVSAVLVAVALLLVLAPPGHAGGRYYHNHGYGGTRVFVGVGPAFWYGPYPYGYFPPPYYYSPYYYPSYVYTPPTIVQDPPVYIQQQPQQQPAAAEPSPPEGYWYYCGSAREYYPRVGTCPEAWIKVPPRQEQR